MKKVFLLIAVASIASCKEIALTSQAAELEKQTKLMEDRNKLLDKEIQKLDSTNAVLDRIYRALILKNASR
jgi:hypothetical protein